MRVPYRRLLIYAIAFAVAIVMNFLLPRLMPGSPVEAMIAQFGKRATPAMIEGEPNAPLLFGYLYLVFVGLSVVGHGRNWWWMSIPTSLVAFALPFLSSLVPFVPLGASSISSSEAPPMESMSCWRAAAFRAFLDLLGSEGPPFVSSSSSDSLSLSSSELLSANKARIYS